MSKSRTKRQHTVPRFYLEYFAGLDGLVWTYDKRENTSRSGTAENTAVQTNFYSLIDESGEYVDHLEDWLSGVESDAAPIYPKLMNGDLPEGQQKANLAVFFSSLLLRSPGMVRANAQMYGLMVQQVSGLVLSNRKRFEQTMDKVDKERGTETDSAMRDAVFEFARDPSKYVVQVEEKRGLKGMGAIDKITEILFDMNWTVTESRNQHLITSDSPVVRVSPPETNHPLYGDGGFMNKRVLVTVPLSPSKMLEMTWTESPGPGVYQVDKQRGRLYNRQRAGLCERYIYSSRADGGIKALARKYRSPGLRFITSNMDQLAPVEIKRRLD